MEDTLRHVIWLESGKPKPLKRLIKKLIGKIYNTFLDKNLWFKRSLYYIFQIFSEMYAFSISLNFPANFLIR